MKHLILFVTLLISISACNKPKSNYGELLENKRWYVYKEVTNIDTFNMSRQYWFEAKRGIFKDYDKFEGTYQIKNDTFRIYFFNYGYETYFIESVDNNNLILKQTNPKGNITYRKLFFN